MRLAARHSNQEYSLFLARFCALTVTLATGFTGLVYEVTWHRYLANILGSQARATAIIIGVFLGGLSVGYAIFGRISFSRSPRQLVQTCGVIEIAIGVWALLFPYLFSIVWNTVGVMPLDGWYSICADIGLSVALIGLPTVLMGGTLPLLTQGLSRDLNDAAPFHARVYAINTTGAFLGCLLAGFLLLPAWGLSFTLFSMGLVNLAAGAALLLVGAPLSEQPPRTADSLVIHSVRSGGARSFPVSVACFVAFISGFSSITLQTGLIRLIGLSMGSSEYAFSMIVSAFILMLALGAWQVGATSTGRSHGVLIGAEESPLVVNQLVVIFGAVLLYLLVPFWPYGVHVIRTLLTKEVPAFYLYFAIIFVCVGGLTLIPVGGMGRILPLLFRETASTVHGLGSNVGKLYGWNTCGCVVGALLGGYGLLYFVDLDLIFRINLGLVCLSLMALTPWTRSPRKGLTATLGLIVALASIAILPSWPREYFAIGTFRHRNALPYSYAGVSNFYSAHLKQRKVIAYKDDPNTTVAVVEHQASGAKEHGAAQLAARSLWVNGKSDGNTVGGDLRTTRLLAHYPALLHRASSRRAAVVGFGTGITVGSLTLYPELETIDCLEISPFVKEFSRYFDGANHSAGSHPKVRWFINDAYRVLSGSGESYGVIVSEPSNPWLTGVERLYAKEFFQIVSHKLAAGGIFSQWIHGYALSADTLGVVLKTFSSVFPYVRIFHNDSDIILLGSNEPFDERSLTTLQHRYETLPEVRGELSEIYIDSVGGLLARELWLPVELFESSAEHNLDHPKLAFGAGRDFFVGSDLNLNELPEVPRYRPMTRRFWQSGMYNSWLDSRRVENDRGRIGQFVADLCEQWRPHFNRYWHRANYQCRAALVALAVSGEIPSEPFFPEQDLELLRKMARTQIPLSLDEAIRGVDLYGEYASPMVGISSARAVDIATPCLQGRGEKERRCRVALVEALAWNGAGDAAASQLARLQSDRLLDNEDLFRLRHLVTQARSEGLAE